MGDVTAFICRKYELGIIVNINNNRNNNKFLMETM